MTAAEAMSSIACLVTLENLYRWEDHVSVRKLLVEHPETHGPLIHAASLIPRYFGPDARLSLGVEHDLDGKEPPRLSATVSTSQPPREALASLDRFDEDWWLDSMTNVHRYLSFGLRFE